MIVTRDLLLPSANSNCKYPNFRLILFYNDHSKFIRKENRKLYPIPALDGALLCVCYASAHNTTHFYANFKRNELKKRGHTMTARGGFKYFVKQ